MGLRIGQCQRGAPGAADHHPALKGKFLADRFHVRDQMRQRVVFATVLRAAATGAALIEQHRVEAFGIEQTPVIRLASAAGPAMQVDGGNAAFAADALDMDVVAVADRQQFGGQRRKGIAASHARIRRHLDLPSPACRPRNCDR